MALKCILVDDEMNNLDTLSLLLSYIPDLEILGAFNRPEDAIEALDSLKPDLLFLDIQMPMINGFDLLQIWSEKRDFFVIFVTAHSNYAIQAIKAEAADYLLKPLVFSELQEAVEKVRQKLSHKLAPTPDKSGRIPLPSSKGFELVHPDDIIRCHGSGSYTDFYLAGKSKITVSKNLGEFESLLQERGLYRVHASHIIQPRHAVSYIKEDGGYIVMSDGAQVPVSRRKKEEVLKLLLG